MLTGDTARVARAVADHFGIEQVRADLLPEDKVSVVRELMREHGSVAMVGDGVNDAPALAAATVGVAMGAAGTDVALESADVALMSDDLSRLPYAIRVSRAARAIIRQNIAFSLLVKLAFLMALVPGWTTLWLAVLADTGATVLVVLNSLRLLRLRPTEVALMPHPPAQG
jgi:Cd2+/Zn2+-exporting ATPase